MNKTKGDKRYAFASINRWYDNIIPLPTEIERSGRGYVLWGDTNDYPNYLLDLYNNVTSLKTIINGTADYVLGNEVTYTRGVNVNRLGETIEDIIHKLAMDYLIFGGFALSIIKGKDLSTIAEIYHIDLRHLRWDKEMQTIYYSEDFTKKWHRIGDIITYPKYMPYNKVPASIYIYKNDSHFIYPFPIYGASIKACEIERAIDEYHLNSINNGFACSYLVNFNNGKPTDAIQEQIENDFNDKFAGQRNAGQILFSFNDDKESQTVIQKLEIQDFGEKYSALANHSRQQIYNAFRATPNLFGLPTETTGFSQQEYLDSFKLFNRTVIKPIQKILKRSFFSIFGEEVIDFLPFTLE